MSTALCRWLGATNRGRSTYGCESCKLQRKPSCESFGTWVARGADGETVDRGGNPNTVCGVGAVVQLCGPRVYLEKRDFKAMSGVRRMQLGDKVNWLRLANGGHGYKMNVLAVVTKIGAAKVQISGAWVQVERWDHDERGSPRSIPGRSGPGAVTPRP